MTMEDDRRILIHTCCAPCLCYPVKVLRAQGLEPWGFWYNPNIHPYTEYAARKQSFIDFTKSEHIRVLWRDQYDIEEFLNQTAFRQEMRCEYCYSIRLEAVAQFARNGRFTHFTSTLLYSKFQNHQMLKELAENYARKYGVKFYYQDFRAGWEEGIRISKDRGLYRQQYCGCIYSERDRYYSEEDRKHS